MSGPMVVTEQDEKVNSAEVDAIGGAKPEPEERPVVIEMKVAPGTGEVAAESPGAAELKLDRAKTVAIEMTVEERAALLGKYCGNCLHFNRPQGQAKLEVMAFRGSPEDRAHLKSLFAELTEQGGPENETDDFVGADEVFAPTYAEKAMATMGLCLRATNFLSEDVFVMPECHCAGQNIPEIKKDIWEPKNSEVARQVNEMRDALYGAAMTPAVLP